MKHSESPAVIDSSVCNSAKMFGQHGKRMNDEMEEQPKTVNSEGFLKNLCV